MPFGPATLIFYWPKKKISGQPKAGPHFRYCKWVRAKTARLSNLPVLSPRVYIRTWQTVFKLLIDYTNIENVGCIVQVIISP